MWFVGKESVKENFSSTRELMLGQINCLGVRDYAFEEVKPSITGGVCNSR